MSPGNSISFYGWETVPASANWSYSHNAVSRPARNDHRNWIFHESMTTDGPGGFGAGTLDAISADGRTITLGFELAFPAANIAGATAMVCSGGGAGQHSAIAGRSYTVDAQTGRNVTMLHLNAPFDRDVVLGPSGSTICLAATVGSKILSGNTFSWGMAVRWFGTTVRGVIADNNLTDCNVGKGEGQSQGAIQGWGTCTLALILGAFPRALCPRAVLG